MSRGDCWEESWKGGELLGGTFVKFGGGDEVWKGREKLLGGGLG